MEFGVPAGKSFSDRLTARSPQPEQSHDLAPVNCQVQVMDTRFPGPAPVKQLKCRLGEDAILSPLSELVGSCSQHEADQLRAGRFRGRYISNHFAIAKDDDAVTYLEYLIHAMRDEDDAQARLNELAQNAEELPALATGQRRCGLVEHQHLRASRERFDDFDQLPFREGEVGHAPADMQVDAKFLCLGRGG